MNEEQVIAEFNLEPIEFVNVPVFNVQDKSKRRKKEVDTNDYGSDFAIIIVK